MKTSEGLRICGKAQVLRADELDNRERQQYILGLQRVLSDWTGDGPPSRLKRILRSIVSFLPDAFYTLTTICICRRRLGEEYTYVAMHKSKQFREEGVLLNNKTRLLLAIISLVSRHLAKHLLNQTALLLTADWEEVVGQTQWFVLMTYMLNWTKCSAILQSILGIQYVYTFETTHVAQVSYVLQGYLLLLIFVFKIGKFIYEYLKKKPKAVIKDELEKQQRNLLCRICLEEAKSPSAAVCGHVFCWNCVMESLKNKQECPLCRKVCYARQVIRIT